MIGKYVTVTTMGDPFKAFVPDDLPRSALTHTPEIKGKIEAAETALAKLNVANELVKGEKWILYGFVRKEALISSQIEGTQATLTDLLAANEKLPDTPDLEEVCNYLSAIKYAWQQMENPSGLPLSVRLIKEAHRHLMNGVRGSNKTPGEFRKVQNWIGSSKPQNAVFVPPPPDTIEDCLSDLERFIYDAEDLHPLIRISMIHVQFETIHPFLDGNGRLGRLLIALMLKEYGILQSPLLYLSLYFKKWKQEYYDHLNQVRFESSWDRWNIFFLEGIIEVAENVVDTAKKLNQIVNEDRTTVLGDPKVSVNAIRLFETLPMNPIITQSKAVIELKTTKPPALKAISLLEEIGILVETTGKKRDRVYQYKSYLNVLSSGTEL
jgi:Fic family protein